MAHCRPGLRLSAIYIHKSFSSCETWSLWLLLFSVISYSVWSPWPIRISLHFPDWTLVAILLTKTSAYQDHPVGFPGLQPCKFPSRFSYHLQTCLFHFLPNPEDHSQISGTATILNLGTGRRGSLCVRCQQAGRCACLLNPLSSDVTKHRIGRTVHTCAKYRSWVLVKCVWWGAYYWFRLRKGTGYGFHAFLTCILLLCCLFSVRYRCIWGRCGWCSRCGVSWHPSSGPSCRRLLVRPKRNNKIKNYNSYQFTPH